jgi:predicted amidohydrolase
MDQPTKISLLSCRPRKWDKAYNADLLEAFVRRANRKRPDLILGPEGMLEGYVVNEVIREPSTRDAMVEVAEPIDGPAIKRFRKLARTLKVCIAFGFAERIRREVYNAAVFIDPQGNICGKYHKTQFAEGYHHSWSFNRIGRKLRAFNTPLGRIGFLICNDRGNPMIARALALDGARLLLVPSYGSRSKPGNIACLKGRSAENGVPVAFANVGINILVSQGQVVAVDKRLDWITTGVVEMPAVPSKEEARAAERAYLQAQGPEMRRRHRATMLALRNEK